MGIAVILAVLAGLFVVGLTGPLADRLRLPATVVLTGHRVLAKRPKLDLALPKDEFARKFPLFAKMPEAARQRLAQRQRTAHAEPGKVLMQHGEVARGVWFIASGAAAMLQAGPVTRLGRGEMFGELALDAANFPALARENAVSALIVARAAKRGVTLDLGAFAARIPARPLTLRWPRARHWPCTGCMASIPAWR